MYKQSEIQVASNLKFVTTSQQKAAKKHFLNFKGKVISNLKLCSQLHILSNAKVELKYCQHVRSPNIVSYMQPL